MTAVKEMYRERTGGSLGSSLSGRLEGDDAAAARGYLDGDRALGALAELRGAVTVVEISNCRIELPDIGQVQKVLSRLNPDEIERLREMAKSDPAAAKILEQGSQLVDQARDEAAQADQAVGEVPDALWAKHGIAPGDMSSLQGRTPNEIEEIMADIESEGFANREQLLSMFRRNGMDPSAYEGLKIISDPQRVQKQSANKANLLADLLDTDLHGARAGHVGLEGMGNRRNMMELQARIREASGDGLLEHAELEAFRAEYTNLTGRFSRSFNSSMDDLETAVEVATVAKDVVKYGSKKVMWGGTFLMTGGNVMAANAAESSWSGALEFTETFANETIVNDRDAGTALEWATQDGLFTAGKDMINSTISGGNPLTQAALGVATDGTLDTVHNSLKETREFDYAYEQVLAGNDPQGIHMAQIRNAKDLDHMIAQNAAKSYTDAAVNQVAGVAGGDGLGGKLVSNVVSHNVNAVKNQGIDATAENIRHGRDADFFSNIGDAGLDHADAFSDGRAAKHFIRNVASPAVMTSVQHGESKLRPGLMERAQESEGFVPRDGNHMFHDGKQQRVVESREDGTATIIDESTGQVSNVRWRVEEVAPASDQTFGAAPISHSQPRGPNGTLVDQPLMEGLNETLVDQPLMTGPNGTLVDVPAMSLEQETSPTGLSKEAAMRAIRAEDGAGPDFSDPEAVRAYANQLVDNRMEVMGRDFVGVKRPNTITAVEREQLVERLVRAANNEGAIRIDPVAVSAGSQSGLDGSSSVFKAGAMADMADIMQDPTQRQRMNQIEENAQLRITQSQNDQGQAVPRSAHWSPGRPDAVAYVPGESIRPNLRSDVILVHEIGHYNDNRLGRLDDAAYEHVIAADGVAQDVGPRGESLGVRRAEHMAVGIGQSATGPAYQGTEGHYRDNRKKVSQNPRPVRQSLEDHRANPLYQPVHGAREGDFDMRRREAYRGSTYSEPAGPNLSGRTQSTEPTAVSGEASTPDRGVQATEDARVLGAVSPDEGQRHVIRIGDEDIQARGYRADDEVMANHNLRDMREAEKMRSTYFDDSDSEAAFQRFKNDAMQQWSETQGESGVDFGLDDATLRTHFDTLRSMNDSELKAVMSYWGGAGPDVNRTMRGDVSMVESSVEQVQVNIKAMLHSLDQLPKYEGVSHRGFELTPDEVPDFMQKYRDAIHSDGIVHEPQFMSSSARPESNVHLTPSMSSEDVHIQYEFESSQGMDYRAVNVPEDEVIMPPGAYRVLAVEKELVGDKWCYTIRMGDLVDVDQNAAQQEPPTQ
jgi:hypothetical protein